MQQEVIGAARAGGRCWHGSRSCTSRRAWSRSRRPVRNQGSQLLSGRAKQHWRASSKQIKKIDRDRDNKHDHQGGQGEGWQRAVKSGGQRRACSQTLTVEASAVGWKAEVFSLQNAVKCQGTGSAKAVDGQGKAAHRQRTGSAQAGRCRGFQTWRPEQWLGWWRGRQQTTSGRTGHCR